MASRFDASTLVAIGLLLATPVHAHPPPPPPPDLAARLIHESCGSTVEKAPPLQVPVTLETIDPASLHMSAKTTGRLRWRWGFRISGPYPNIGRVTGLDLNGEYGLIGVTSAGYWITFDIRRGTLSGLTSVGLAPIAASPGTPTGIVQLQDRTLVAFPKQRAIADFGLAGCGFAARPVNLFTISGEPEATTVVEASGTYIGIVGQDERGVKTQLELPYAPAEVRLDQADIPSLPGYRLQALSNTARIAPDLVAAWRPLSGEDRTRFQRMGVSNWNDMRFPDEKPPDELGEIPKRLSAMTSIYDGRTDAILIFAIAEPDNHKSIEVYAFTFGPEITK